ncbi:MAG TPA: hypothetical protein ENI23_08205 [bacterium]|nr:hypothetical protein [bacterium]
MRTIISSIRECGERIPGGVYLTSEGSTFGSLPLWVSLHNPISCEDRPHRGPVLVDAGAILARLPEEKWFVGSSEAHREKLRADEWAIERFGMTTTMRSKIGVAADTTGADEAMEILLGSVKWNGSQVEKYVAILTDLEVPEIPQVTEHFASLISHLQDFPVENRAIDLVLAIAAVWRIADNLPPRFRTTIIPNLMRFLVVLGVPEDAVALRKRYSNEFKR